ncbi:type II and III secretion system protein family protein [Planctomycetaceae bacterium SH139]
MVVKRKFRRAAIAALLAGFLASSMWAEDCLAQNTRPASSVVQFNVTQSVETLQMIVKSSRILTMEKPILKYQVQNEQILTASPISATQIQIASLTPGMTQLNLWDSENNLFTVDCIVGADAREVETILTTQFPGSNLKVTALSQGTGAVLSGTVNNVDDVDRAVQIVEQFYADVVTNVRVVGVQQIMLHTKIMEVSRTKFRELGIDWALSDKTNATGVLFGAGDMLNAPGSDFATIAPVSLQANTRFAAELGGYDLDGLVKALRRNDLIKVLAEPTVVSTHGRPSRFIVGGKVPYIVPTGNGAVAIEYEEFGTAVDFLPFVIGPNRVRLEVRPEVSEPDPARSITVQGATVPAFRQRYVDTAVELNTGQTFAIAGLLQNRVESVSRATPFFGELPWIGTFFRRISEQNNEIELLITVTPELAEAMDDYQVPVGGPGLNTDSPSDTELFLRGYLEVPRTDGMCLTPSAAPGAGYGGAGYDGTGYDGTGYLPAGGEHGGYPMEMGAGPAMRVPPGQMSQPLPGGYQQPAGQMEAIPPGEINSAGNPPAGNLIVPGSRPTTIAPGVSVMSPSSTTGNVSGY